MLALMRLRGRQLDPVIEPRKAAEEILAAPERASRLQWRSVADHNRRVSVGRGARMLACRILRIGVVVIVPFWTCCAAMADEDRPPGVHLVADYTGSGARIRLDTLPLSVRKKYEATGTLRCTMAAQPRIVRDVVAQVTAERTLITTAAHAFINPATCKQEVLAADCKFRPRGAAQGIAVKLLEAGYQQTCPNPAQDQDWAILQLSSEADVKPYPVSETTTARASAGDRLTVVAHAQDFPDSNAPDAMFGWPMYMVDCTLRDFYRSGLLATDCASGGGSSGATCLDRDGYLVGVLKGNLETDADMLAAMKKRTTNRRPYDRQTWATMCTPVRGQFYAALTRAIASATAPVFDDKLGLAVASLTDELRRRFAVADDVRGVIITAVDRDAAVARSSVEEGQVLIMVAGEPVATPRDFRSRLDVLRKQQLKTTVFLVSDHGRRRTVTLPLQ